MRNILTVLVIALSVFALGASFFSIYENHENAQTRSVELCRNQHAIIEMQRLFLVEHAAIRVQLQRAGIPNTHADPNLLMELGVLIDAADCDVSKLK